MRNTCEVEDCDSPVAGQGLCRKHYMRKRRKGTTDDARKNARGVCSVPGCGRPHEGHGLCRNHRLSQANKLMRVEAKERKPRSCGFCGTPIPSAKRRRGPVSYCDRTCKEKAWVATGGNRVAALKSYYKRRYGMTQEEVAALLAGQGGGCAICGIKEPKGRHGGFHTDHDHATGRVRGILCHSCNVGLGHFKDDPELLRRALAYLSA